MTYPWRQRGERGRIARALVFGLAVLMGGCATAPTGKATIQPGPQQQPTNQVVGDAIVASLGGVAVTVRWLDSPAVVRYFAGRPGLVFPWPQDTWESEAPTVFLLRIRNQTRAEVQFDPGLAALVTQEGKRERPIPYEEMYTRLAEGEGAGPRLQSLQATLFSRFVVIPPSGQREGLLVFPALTPEAKHLLLELASFFVGGRINPGLFEFQVVRGKPE